VQDYDTGGILIHLKSRRNLIQKSTLIACLPSLAFSQNNSLDIGSTVPWSQVKLLNDEVLKSSSVPTVVVYNKLGQMVQYEKGQMFTEDIQSSSRWL